MIPVTIFTGFLGSGKTTLINKIIKQNPNIKFGFIINEFGEVGIDGTLIEASENEVFELSSGCICCIVRKDLVDAVKKLTDRNDIDYLIIESSGLAEPLPVAQTFAVPAETNALLDAIICTVDAENFLDLFSQFSTIKEQLKFCDFVVLNKTESVTKDITTIINKIKSINPHAKIIENTADFDSNFLIDTKYWDLKKLESIQATDEVCEHDHDHKEHEHNEHHHEHDEVDEVCFVTEKLIDYKKLQEWSAKKYPVNVVRAKGFIRIKNIYGNASTFLLQAVTTNRGLIPYEILKENFDKTKTRLVFIGKDIDKKALLTDLENICCEE